MIARNYKLIQDITKELGLNNGKGFSNIYVYSVLQKNNKRKNEDIEVIATAIDEAIIQTKNQLIHDFESYKKGNAHWVRVVSKRLNHTVDA